MRKWRGRLIRVGGPCLAARGASFRGDIMINFSCDPAAGHRLAALAMEDVKAWGSCVTLVHLCRHDLSHWSTCVSSPRAVEYHVTTQVIHLTTCLSAQLEQSLVSAALYQGDAAGRPHARGGGHRRGGGGAKVVELLICSLFQHYSTPFQVNLSTLEGG